MKKYLIKISLTLCLLASAGVMPQQLHAQAACGSAGETVGPAAEFGNTTYAIGDLTVVDGGADPADVNDADWYFGPAANVDVYAAVTIPAGVVVRLKAGAVLNVYGNFTNNGYLFVEPGATINFYGTTWTNAPTAIVGDGVATANTVPGGNINFVAARPAVPVSASPTACVLANYSGGNFAQNLDGGNVPMDIDLHVKNANNIVLINTATKIEGKVDFDVLEGDIILGNNNLVFTANATYATANNQYDGYAVTNGTGVVTKENMPNGSVFTFPVGQAENDYTPTTITNTAGTRAINVQVKTYANSGSTETNPAIGMDRTWQITSPVAGTANICLTHNTATNPAGPGSDGVSFTNAAAYVTQQTTVANWFADLPASANGGSPVSTHCHSYTVPASIADPTSYFTKSQGLKPLPVTLSSFNGKAANCTAVLLNWTINNAMNFKQFELERSTGGGTYTTVSTIAHSSNSSYSYTDNNLANGIYQYRLKMTDANGTFSYSAIVVVKLTCGGNPIVLYPNPTRDNVHISGLKGGEMIQMLGVNGQLMVQLKAVNNRQQIDMTKFAAGVYTVIVWNDNERVLVTKVIKDNK